MRLWGPNDVSDGNMEGGPSICFRQKLIEKAAARVRQQCSVCLQWKPFYPVESISSAQSRDATSFDK